MQVYFYVYPDKPITGVVLEMVDTCPMNIVDVLAWNWIIFMSWCSQHVGLTSLSYVFTSDMRLAETWFPFDAHLRNHAKQ